VHAPRRQEGAARRPDHCRGLGQCGWHGPGFSTQFRDVEVDPETGKVTILRFVAAQDVGCAIHPSYVEGQIQGGVAQGIGWALNEEYIYDTKGRLDNAGFLDYRVPVASSDVRGHLWPIRMGILRQFFLYSHARRRHVQVGMPEEPGA
jgi:hypothetical protein